MFRFPLRAARVERLVAGCAVFRAASVVVFNFSEPLPGAGGIRRFPARVVQEYANTADAGCAHPAAVVFELRLALETGLHRLFNTRLEYVSRMPSGPTTQIAVARGLARLRPSSVWFGISITPYGVAS